MKTIPFPTLQLASAGARARSGHPWVYDNEVSAPLPSDEDGRGVALTDLRGRFLGMGVYNSRSRILWRRYASSLTAWDEAFVSTALSASQARRPSAPYQRMVWSEADFLPGLVVDRFGEVVVVQALTCGADRLLPAVLKWLEDHLHPREVVLRNDAPSREKEGLRRESGTTSGRDLPPEWHTIDGIQYLLDLSAAQKTGFYLDQRPQHRKVGALAGGRRVLDAFCNQGSFGLHCAMGGAHSVLALDSSPACIAQVESNSARNHLPVEARVANVFDFFTQERERSFDLIVLDPPSFARNRAAVAGARRGYKELNLRALRCLAPGGILATYSCSQHIGLEEFTGVLTDAAFDARRAVHVLEWADQPSDHPQLLTFPESRYLKGAILRAE